MFVSFTKLLHCSIGRKQILMMPVALRGATVRRVNVWNCEYIFKYVLNHTLYDMLYLCILIWVFCSYCDCFGAGLFCGDGCACDSCGNRVEFQETVVETKHHIESRNPDAFAPKIVKCAADVPQNNMV